MSAVAEIRALHQKGMYSEYGNDVIKESIVKLILSPLTLLLKCLKVLFKIITFSFGGSKHRGVSTPNYNSGTRQQPLTNEEKLNIYSARLGYDKNDESVPESLRDVLKY